MSKSLGLEEFVNNKTEKFERVLKWLLLIKFLSCVKEEAPLTPSQGILENYKKWAFAVNENLMGSSSIHIPINAYFSGLETVYPEPGTSADFFLENSRIGLNLEMK